MPLNNRIEGIAIYCDLNGQIKSILRDDIGFSNLNPVGRLFPNVLANKSNTNFLDFMLEVKEKNIAFDYRFDLEVNERSYNLYFFGILIAEKILVIGADNHKEAMEFADHLQQVNNEQSNLIRSLYKEKYSRQNEDKDTQQLFEEVSKLNNELINVQRELFKKNIELEKLNQLKNHFLGMAAHDLRNPLTIITNYAEFIMEDNADKLSEQTNTFLMKIHNSAYFMLELIEDILDVSKIETGKLHLNLDTVDIINFTKDIIKRNNVIAAKKDIQIHLERAVETFPIKIDKLKIEQVFNNLLSNAVKFSYPNSEIFVKFDTYTDKIQVRVKDSGTGIKEEFKDKLFIPFQKNKIRGTKDEKGTGLGLSIVKRIIEGHKGEIWFESELGKGTSFFFTLPTQ